MNDSATVRALTVVDSEMSRFRADAEYSFSKAAEISGATISASRGVQMRSQSNAAQAKQTFYREFRGWVYVAINSIAKRAAAQEVYAGRTVEGSKSRKVPRYKLPEGIRSKASTGGMEMVTDHPILRAFECPNKVQSRWAFTYTTVASLYITGEAYWIAGAKEDSEGEVKLELFSIPSSWMTPKHEGELFSGYNLRLPGEFEPIPLDASQVVRLYLPDPANPLMGAISPLGTQMSAVRIDGKIQASQEASYDNGIFPRVAISIGQDVLPDGRPMGKKPVLSGAQRRQILTAVRQVWGGVANSGEPAILDGLIEKIFPIENKPKEMDWLGSGDQVKTRIFQAFSLNPINVGEVTGANRAQAAVADEHMATNTINPVLDIMSAGATSFSRELFEDEGLYVWWDPCVPRDKEQRLRENSLLRKYDDITRNEIRQEYGYPPLEDVEGKRPQILDTAAAMTASVEVLSSMNQGMIGRTQAVSLFDVFFGSGVGEQIVGGETVTVPAETGDDDTEDEEESVEEMDELEVEDANRAAAVQLLRWVTSERAGKMADLTIAKVLNDGSSGS